VTDSKVGKLITKDRKVEHLLITKTNRLAQAGNNLSVIEAKVLEYCFANVFKEDNITAHDIFEINVDVMADYFNLQRGHAYRELKTVFQSLLRKILKIDLLGKKFETPWLSAIGYEDAKGILTVQLSPIVCDHVSFKLLQTEHFTQYHLSEVAGLRYKFSNVLFNFISSKTFKEGLTRIELTLEELRELFLLDENEMALYGDLKRHLVKSLEELQSKTKLNVELKERKTGKKVTSVVFLLS
jgi:plasmid replication initiation protein